MTDPTSNQPEIKDEDVANFSFWLVMLPFLAAAIVFVYLWSMHHGENQWLMYAVGSLLIGAIVTAVIGGAMTENGDTTSGAK